jgi:tetratricopeptide (TPR) repeat protein
VAFKEGEYKVAARLYGCAIDLAEVRKYAQVPLSPPSPLAHTCSLQEGSDQLKFYYSNRSASFCQLKRYDEARRDAQRAVELDESWHKAWYRKGIAEEGLEDYSAAERSFARGLDCAPRYCRTQRVVPRSRAVLDGRWVTRAEIRTSSERIKRSK